MKRFLFLAAVAAIAVPALDADAGVSVKIGEPGFYGSIDIGSFPQSQLIYPQSIVIQRIPVGVVREPIYLHVPPGHAKHWCKHCRKYKACGQPVYFVRNTWYTQEYVPRYRETTTGVTASVMGMTGATDMKRVMARERVTTTTDSSERLRRTSPLGTGTWCIAQ
jgi:hypothetical protein